LAIKGKKKGHKESLDSPCHHRQEVATKKPSKEAILQRPKKKGGGSDGKGNYLRIIGGGSGSGIKEQKKKGPDRL